MLDTHTYRDHRYEEARATGCRRAAERGFDFRPAEPSYDLGGVTIVIGLCALIAAGFALVCAVS